MPDSEMVAIFELGGVARFEAPCEQVHAYADRLETEFGIELQRQQLIGAGVLVWIKDKAPHPLGTGFMKRTLLPEVQLG